MAGTARTRRIPTQEDQPPVVIFLRVPPRRAAGAGGSVWPNDLPAVEAADVRAGRLDDLVQQGYRGAVAGVAVGLELGVPGGSEQLGQAVGVIVGAAGPRRQPA